VTTDERGSAAEPAGDGANPEPEQSSAAGHVPVGIGALGLLVGALVFVLGWYVAFLRSAPFRYARFGEPGTQESATLAWELRTAGNWLLVFELTCLAGLGAAAFAAVSSSHGRLRIGGRTRRRVRVLVPAFVAVGAVASLVGPCTAGRSYPDERVASVAAATFGRCMSYEEGASSIGAAEALAGAATTHRSTPESGQYPERREVASYQAMVRLTRGLPPSSEPGPTLVEALHLFRRRLGRYPADLRELVPALLPDLPASALLGYPQVTYTVLGSGSGQPGFELKLEPPAAAERTGPAVRCRPKAAWSSADAGVWGWEIVE
jgi:hypothetical protein